MNFQNIYEMAVKNTLSGAVLNEFVIANEKEFRRNNRFVDIYKLLCAFKDNNRFDLMDILLNNISLKNKVFGDIFRFIFDERYRNEETFYNILSRDYYLTIEGFNILFEHLTSFNPDRENYINIFDNYMNVALTRDIDDFLDGIDFAYVNKDNLADIYITNPEYLKRKLKEYFKNNKDKSVEFWGFNTDLYEEFKDYSDQIRYEGISYTELIYLDNLLKDKLNCKTGFKVDVDVLKRLWDYGMEVNDNHISNDTMILLKKHLFDCLMVDYKVNPPSEVYVPPAACKYIGDMIEKTKRYNADTKFTIDPDEALTYLDEFMKYEDEDRIFVVYRSLDDDGKLSLHDYIRSHRFYQGTADLVNRFDFSPLEKYIYSYYLTCIFKKYRFYRDDENIDTEYHQLSRDKYYIIYGDYIVCAGYVNYLNNLLNMVGIRSEFLTIEPPETQERHARNITHLVDSKYGIDGVYIGDPTFDSADEISFRHAFMNKSKESYMKYQHNDDEASFNFYNAMHDLGFDEEYCDYRNPQFFDILNREIPDEVKIKAITSVMSKIHPDYSDEEVDKLVFDIANNSNINYLPEYIKKQKCKDLDGYHCLDKVVDIPKVLFKWVSNETDNRSYIKVGFLLGIEEMDSYELFSKVDGSSLLDDDVKVIYSEYYASSIIEFKLDIDSNVTDLIELIERNVFKVLKYLGISVDKCTDLVPVNKTVDLYEVINSNSDLAYAIYFPGDSSVEENVANLYVDGKIDIFIVITLIKHKVIDKNKFFNVCKKFDVNSDTISANNKLG